MLRGWDTISHTATVVMSTIGERMRKKGDGLYTQEKPTVFA